MEHEDCIALVIRGPLVDLGRTTLSPIGTTISPINFVRLLWGADEMMHVKAMDCEMLEKCQVCVLCLHLFSCPFSPLSHSQALFSAANYFLKMRPPVWLNFSPHSMLLCIFFVHAVPFAKRTSPSSSCALLAPLYPLGFVSNISSSRKPSFILSNGNHSQGFSHHTPKAG